MLKKIVIIVVAKLVTFVIITSAFKALEKKQTA
jgi:hypothetical protein